MRAWYEKLSKKALSKEMKRRAAKGRAKAKKVKAKKDSTITQGAFSELLKPSLKKTFEETYNAHAPEYERMHKKGPEIVRPSQEEADAHPHVCYIWGKVETIIEHYSDSTGVSRSALANGLAGILQHQTRW